ncbi:MAG TPA: hypothetical protein VLG09_02565 [Candidatus Saccharimonadales bacterium]|nr:hypothetical protein [Candidatus Saccharimonadales bacterium]
MNPVIEQGLALSIVHEEVQHGVDFLDEVMPNWHEKIDLRKFDLGDASECVCGQVFANEVSEGSWADSGYGYARHTFPELSDNGEGTFAYGFEVDGLTAYEGIDLSSWEEPDKYYMRISEIELDWIYVIKERQDANA